jgi:hypothetical protein
VIGTRDYALELNTAFRDKPYFSRAELAEYFGIVHPQLSARSINWLVYNLQNNGIIQRVTRNRFILKSNENHKHTEYLTFPSDELSAVIAAVSERFPLVSFIAWETRALNDFANHQLARNHIFVEVEKMLEDPVFEFLHENFSCPVLFKPSHEEIYLYSEDTTISVITLRSEAPTKGHDTTIEKMLVDLFANKLLEWIVSKGDFAGIYEEAFSRHTINTASMLRYARRRNKESIVKEYIERNTEHD